MKEKMNCSVIITPGFSIDCDAFEKKENNKEIIQFSDISAINFTVYKYFYQFFDKSNDFDFNPITRVTKNNIKDDKNIYYQIDMFIGDIIARIQFSSDYILGDYYKNYFDPNHPEYVIETETIHQGDISYETFSFIMKGLLFKTIKTLS